MCKDQEIKSVTTYKSYDNSNIDDREQVKDLVGLPTYLDTWSGFEAAKTAPWPSRGLHHCGKFLDPQMSELVEDAIAS